ncbi:MAG: dihydrolipoamide acetyltransferase family protein [Negativicutes bacterium]
MATEYKMPQLGLTMTEGTVTKWFKSVGESVAVGEILVEVSTDKITNQLESSIAGVVLKILVPEGGVAPVQATIAVIGQPGEKVAAVATVQPAREQVAADRPVATLEDKPLVGDGKRIKASPYAKKIAKEKGIDLSVVTGTGPDGRIVERDVLAFAASVPTAAKTSPLAAKLASELGVDLSNINKDGRIMKDDVLAAAKATVAAPVAARTKPLAGMRKVIADRMQQSWNTAPHVHLTVDIDMTNAIVFKELLAKASGQKASVTEIIIKCAAQVLIEMPVVNASIIGNQIVYHDDTAVGVAVSLDDGLIVPVIRDADKKTIREIRAAVVDLGIRARAGKLLPDEISGGTFTVTNLGMFGTDHFTPIINPPESAILAVCRTVEKPVIQNGQIVVRPMCSCVLGFDHRLIDGAVGARYMARFRELMENPALLLI